MAQAPRQELRWGVKASLMAYARWLPDGLIEASDGAEVDADDVFRFPFARTTPGTDDDVLHYTGRIHWFGHAGLMDATLSDPWITLAPRAVLSFEVRLPDMPIERWDIATLTVTETAPGVWEGSAVRLTADGALTLGGLQYHEHQQVDDLTFSAPSASDQQA